MKPEFTDQELQVIGAHLEQGAFRDVAPIISKLLKYFQEKDQPKEEGADVVSE